MNRQQLLSRLARDHAVVYSTGTPQPGRRKVPGGGLAGALLQRDGVFIDLAPTWLMKPTRFALVRRVMEALATRRWRRITADLGDAAFTAYVFHPKFWAEVRHLRPARLVYHAYDLYHLQGRGEYVFEHEERAIVRAADVVIASSAPIAARLTDLGARKVEIVENAADFEAFAVAGELEVPADITAIPSPRIGYTGALNRKVDFSLFLALARRRSTWHLVLIGRVGDVAPAEAAALDQLRSCPNVHFVGFKDRETLPAYMAAMDVNVMAYRLGDDVWTEGISPLKLHEYLAVGQPVVSADIPAVRPFADVIRIAADPADWELAVVEALDGRATGTTTSRRERARLNSWDARVAQIRTLLPRVSDSPAAPRGCGAGG